MEITIKIDGRMVSVDVSDEVANYLNQAKRRNRSLCRERRNHWDGRGFDEYIVSMEGRFPHQETPEATICRRETMDEIMSVLKLCTDIQRERFLLYALYDFSYAEIARMCGCSKVAIHFSIEAVRKKFLKNFRRPT